MRERIRRFYYGEDTVARYFRFGLLIFDLITVLFFVVSSAAEPTRLSYVFDYLIAFVFVLDYAARTTIANRPGRFLVRFTSIADLIVIVSLLATPFIENLAFLRVVRTLRLLRSYHVLRELCGMSSWFRRNNVIIESSVNLFIFVFVVTTVVYVLEGDRNPNIGRVRNRSGSLAA